MLIICLYQKILAISIQATKDSIIHTGKQPEIANYEGKNDTYQDINPLKNHSKENCQCLDPFGKDKERIKSDSHLKIHIKSSFGDEQADVPQQEEKNLPNEQKRQPWEKFLSTDTQDSTEIYNIDQSGTEFEKIVTNQQRRDPETLSRRNFQQSFNHKSFWCLFSFFLCIVICLNVFIILFAVNCMKNEIQALSKARMNANWTFNGVTHNQTRFDH